MSPVTFEHGRRRFVPGPTARPAGSASGGGKSPYRLGRDFERSTRGRLERRGYFVMRAHGSKGKVDLLAVGIGKPNLGLQCKRRGDIGSAEWNELFDLCVTFGIVPVVVTKTGERTTGFFRLEDRREFGRQGRPWREIDPATGEPIPEQIALA